MSVQAKNRYDRWLAALTVGRGGCAYGRWLAALTADCREGASV